MAMNPVLPRGEVEEEDFEFEYFLIGEEDIILSQWELVNVSDAGCEQYSDSDPYPDPNAAAIRASLHGLPPQEVTPSPCVDPLGPFESISVGDADFSALIEQYRDDLHKFSRVVVAENQEPNSRYDHGEYEDEEDEDDDGLDDELVPRHLSGKLGRQRIRKLGKRICSKMNKSKRSPHLYLKAGCVYGKHGLGLKHNLL